MFWLTLWENADKNFVLAYSEDIKGFSFETMLPGGFGVASFSVVLTRIEALKWYNDYLGKFITIYDEIGRIVYEGIVENIDIKNNTVGVSCVGPYSLANDINQGIIYPISTPKSISAIIIDCVDLVVDWNSYDYIKISTTTTDVTPQDFTGDAKVADAIAEVLRYGSDDVVPRPMHFAVWDDLKPHLFAEPLHTNIDMLVESAYISGGGGDLSVSRSKIYNKIQVVFDDPYIGQTFTGWYENTISQKKFGIREGTVNIGASNSTVADVVGQLSIAHYAYPQPIISISVSGSGVKELRQVELPAYLVRAGKNIRVIDYDGVLDNAIYSGFYDNANPFITRTSYAAETDTVTLEFGSDNFYLDILMTRLGLSSGSIR